MGGKGESPGNTLNFSEGHKKRKKLRSTLRLLAAGKNLLKKGRLAVPLLGDERKTFASYD